MTLPYSLPPRLSLICKVLTGLSLALALAYIAIGLYDGLISKFMDTMYQTIDAKHQAVITISSIKTSALTIISAVIVSGNLFIFLAMANVFRQMSKGYVFALPTAKSIRILGFTVLLFSVLDILSRPIMLVLWTYDSPAGHGLLSLSLSTHQGMMVLMGGLFMVIGHIYVEAIRMADENRQYV